MTTRNDDHASIAPNDYCPREELCVVRQVFGQLSALFAAAQNDSVRGQELMALGRYVADDWANMLDRLCACHVCSCAKKRGATETISTT